MKVTSTFTVRRYWFKDTTPTDVLDTLNIRMGMNPAIRRDTFTPYVDVDYTGESDRNITMMELRYQEWIHHREFISWDVEGDDGLEYPL